MFWGNAAGFPYLHSGSGQPSKCFLKPPPTKLLPQAGATGIGESMFLAIWPA